MAKSEATLDRPIAITAVIDSCFCRRWESQVYSLLQGNWYLHSTHPCRGQPPSEGWVPDVGRWGRKPLAPLTPPHKGLSAKGSRALMAVGEGRE